ncbi:hypothetical protein M2266_006405 [Streptomyces sp. SPB162]|nr:hypothetical protein [Streptomyces sp. SPB162]
MLEFVRQGLLVEAALPPHDVLTRGVRTGPDLGRRTLRLRIVVHPHGGEVRATVPCLHLAQCRPVQRPARRVQHLAHVVGLTLHLGLVMLLRRAHTTLHVESRTSGYRAGCPRIHRVTTRRTMTVPLVGQQLDNGGISHGPLQRQHRRRGPGGRPCADRRDRRGSGPSPRAELPPSDTARSSVLVQLLFVAVQRKCSPSRNAAPDMTYQQNPAGPTGGRTVRAPMDARLLPRGEHGNGDHSTPVTVAGHGHGPAGQPDGIFGLTGFMVVSGQAGCRQKIPQGLGCGVRVGSSDQISRASRSSPRSSPRRSTAHPVQ